MAYQSWSVVFGEQPSAAKWNILGTNDASFNDGTGIADGVIKPEHLKNGSSTLNTWVWDSWTPTLSGRFDDGDWTKNCDYIRIGNTIIAQLSLVATAAAPMGGGSTDAIFTLPVTSTALKGSANSVTLGTAILFDAGTANFTGFVLHASTTTATIRSDNGTGGASAVTSTSPFTWTTSDEVNAIFMYEAA